MQAYTLQEQEWQGTSEQVKDLPDGMLEHMRAFRAESQSKFQALLDRTHGGQYQAVLNSMCDDVTPNAGPWIGTERTHYKHTFKGRTCKSVEINMTPGFMVCLLLLPSCTDSFSCSYAHRKLLIMHCCR